MRLAEALEHMATGVLRRVAAAHGLTFDDGTTRDELIARIADRLGDPAYVEEQLRGLTEDEQTVLTSAHASAGELRGFLVDLDYPGTAEALAERGWLFRVFAAAGPLRGEVFVVPDELLAVLPVPQSESGRSALSTFATLATAATLPSERRSSDPAFSLFALVSALTRAGGHLEAEVRAWSEEPGGWAWDTRWTFLQHLAASTGLVVHRVDGRLVASAGLGRLLDDPSALAERLRRGYLGDAGWSELVRSGVVDDPGLVDTLALRRAIVDLVDQLPENGWTSLERLSEWLQRTRPLVVREQLNPRGLVRLQALGWGDLEFPLLRAFVLGPLYWLGTVAASKDGRFITRRPLSAGPRSAEGRGESGGGGAGGGGGGGAGGRLRGAATPTADRCHWEGTAELVAPPRAELGTLLQAERYLVLRERGHLSRYHLVQAHVGAALAAGGSLAECRQLLVRLTQASLPPEIEERLSTWESRFGSLEIRPAVVLEAQTAGELDQAVDAEPVRPFVRRRLGPSVAEVAAADALELAAALRESGHLPRIDAALRLAAEPRRAYAGLVDEQVLEFLLVSLLAFQTAWPERLSELEGSAGLLERLEHQFPPERLATLRADASRLAGTLSSASSAASGRRARTKRRRRHTP